MRPGSPVISLSKGLEPESRLRMSEVVTDETPGYPAGVLTGPNLAKEVLAGQSAAAVVAMPDEDVARTLQEVLSRDLFKIYRSTDVVGAEIAGALKNVFAIAAGIASGLGAGDNTRALVMCRAIAEMTRLGVAMGGQPMTFAGLAGIGDLLATCISPLSRNRTVGGAARGGRSTSEIVESIAAGGRGREGRALDRPAGRRVRRGDADRGRGGRGRERRALAAGGVPEPAPAGAHHRVPRRGALMTATLPETNEEAWALAAQWSTQREMSPFEALMWRIEAEPRLRSPMTVVDVLDQVPTGTGCAPLTTGRAG